MQISFDEFWQYKETPYKCTEFTDYEKMDVCMATIGEREE
jgi:hypothetical protein